MKNIFFRQFNEETFLRECKVLGLQIRTSERCNPNGLLLASTSYNKAPILSAVVIDSLNTIKSLDKTAKKAMNTKAKKNNKS